MLVAIQGCCHGSLSTIYDSISRFESTKNQKVRLLLICGDFQALRSEDDFASLAVPPKYHQLGSFHRYYSGEEVAPVLTIVIGGNHEASNYMWELYHGGWLAPNIYYLGAAGSVYVDGVRICGASGIYKSHDYVLGHFERVPFDKSTLRSVYHIRQYDITKLMHLPRQPNTIFLSHDWPTTIPHHGDTRGLLRRKPFFRGEVEDDSLGSPPLLELMRHIQPEHWFAAHLHVKFAAVYDHGKAQTANGNQSASVGHPRSSLRQEGRQNGGPSDWRSNRHLQSTGTNSIAVGSRGEGTNWPRPHQVKTATPINLLTPNGQDSNMNPDEISIETDDGGGEIVYVDSSNPDEINIDDSLEDLGNEDEIVIDDDELDDEVEDPRSAQASAHGDVAIEDGEELDPDVDNGPGAINPEEINIEDDDFDEDPLLPIANGTDAENEDGPSSRTETSSSQLPDPSSSSSILPEFVPLPSSSSSAQPSDPKSSSSVLPEFVPLPSSSSQPAPPSDSASSSTLPSFVAFPSSSSTHPSLLASSSSSEHHNDLAASSSANKNQIPASSSSLPPTEALEYDESADLVEAARKEKGQAAAQGIIGLPPLPPSTTLPLPPKPITDLGQSSSSSGKTKFLALDKCGPGKDFIQYLDIPTPEPIESEEPVMTFDPEWLAITRTLHPWLSTEYRQIPLPPPKEIERLIRIQKTRIEKEGLLVPKPGWEEGEEVELMWEKPPIEVSRVQQFWPTARAHGQPGGSPNAWYTNPQTEAFCGFLGIENKINPAPR